MSVGIFESLAADQSDVRLASRKALVLSRDRIDARLGKFLGASRSPKEFDARFDLVAEDFVGIVRVAAREVGHDDPDALVETLRDHYRQAGKPPWLKDDDDSDEEVVEEAKDEGDDDGKKKKKSKKGKKKDKGKDNKPPWLQDSADEGGESDNEDGGDGDDLNFSSKTAAPEGNTGLAGPSPKMDKKRWTPKSVKPIDVPSERHPTVQKDVIDPMPRKNEGPPGDIGNIDEINALTTTETLPTGKGLDDAGFNGDKDTGSSGPTKTWGTDGREADPVRSESLEA